MTSCQTERNFIGIYRVHLTIVNTYANIPGIRTRQRPFFHFFHNTFQNSRHKTGFDHSTYNTVVKHQFTSPRQIIFFFSFDRHLAVHTTDLISRRLGHSFFIGFDDHMYFPELSGSSGLLLMPVIGLGIFRNGFPIRNLRSIKFNLNLIVVFDPPFHRIQMKFSLARKDHLLQFFGVFHQQRRILFVHPIKHFGHFLLVALIHCPDSSTETGIRIFDSGKYIITIFLIQGIPVSRSFQFHGRSEVTGPEFRHFRPVFTGYSIQLCNTFFSTGSHIGQIIPFFHRTGNNFKIVDISQMLLDSRTEYKSRSRAVHFIRHQTTVFRKHSRHGSRTRSHVHQEFHKTPYTHIFFGRHTEHREHITGDQPFPDTGAHFVFRQAPFLKIKLHQPFIVFGSRLDQGIMQFVGFLFLRLRDRQYIGFTPLRFPLIHLHFQDIHHLIETEPLIDRILHQYHFLSERSLCMFQRLFEISFFMIQLVDDKNHRFI